MSWLDDEIEKNRKQAEERQKQFQLQQAQLKIESNAREALYQQRLKQLDQMAEQQLSPIVNSLQVRQLMKEVNRKFKGEYREYFSGLGNAEEFNEPLLLRRVYFGIGLNRSYISSTSGVGFATGRTIKETRNLKIGITISGEPTPIRIEYECNFVGLRELDDADAAFISEEVTLYNHSYLVAKLKKTLGQTTIAFIQKWGWINK